jgi:selenocysteine-specific elongation factor
MHRPGGLVVGTAGHIDHGKTSLVRALTGIDTDRLAEEKRRGISIDLGFAHLAVGNGVSVSFIDVPGHERFIRNMLAGAGGVEAVLLVVAADESVKPQTREHFEICRLLGVKRGLIVLTKADLATNEQIAKTAQDVRALCGGSFLSNAPILPVSAVTGLGLPALKQQLALLAAQKTQRDRSGVARLPIDRSFTLKGFGTIVTGTLWSGTLRIGDTVELHPMNREARIRGLQVHGSAVETAVAGERAAVNLAGVDHLEIKRGFVLTHPQTLAASTAIDIAVDWLASSERSSKPRQFFFHLGTAEVMASLKPLGEQVNFARLTLAQPVVALPGDRFVLRQPSPAQTVAGGTVVDAFPPKRLNRTKTIARLASLAEAGLASRIEILVEESANGQSLDDLRRLTGFPAESLAAAILQNPQLILISGSQLVTGRKTLDRHRLKLIEWLTAFHRSNPATAGAPVAQARLGLEPALAAAVLGNFPAIRVQGDIVALANHKPTFSDRENQDLFKIEEAFRQAGFQPPPLQQVLSGLAPDSKQARSLLEVLIKQQKLVRVSDDMVFHVEAISHLRKSLAAHKGRRFSVPEFKSWTNISRKHAIPLLEYLDRQRITRRDGDARVVL